MLDDAWNSCFSAFRRSGDGSHLEEGIVMMERAVDITPDDHPNMIIWLSRLGMAVHSRFLRTEDLADVDKAIYLFQRAADLTPEDHIDKPKWLANTGNCFESRFTRTGDVSDLDQAILLKQAAIELTPVEDSIALATRLNNLGNSFTSKFKRTGDLTDLAEAISAKQRAVHLLPERHMEIPNVLNNLGISFQRRFYETGELVDLEEAISAYQKAVDLTPDGHAALHSRLSNLGSSLQTRYYRLKNVSDLSKAIPLLEQALQLSPDGHFERPVKLNNLGLAFRSRFEHSQNLDDVDQAILYTRMAIKLTPLHHPNMPIFLSSLGVSQQIHFDYTKLLVDSEAGIATLRQAIELSPNDDPALITRRTNLGMFFERRFNVTKEEKDIISAIEYFQVAATDSFGLPADKFMAAEKWVELAKKYSPTQLVRAYGIAIELMSQVVGLGLTVQRRLHKLPDMSTIATSAAAAALNDGRPDLAVSWLEEARCLVWKQLNNLRSPFDDLRELDPLLYAELKRVSQLLDAAGSREELTGYVSDTVTLGDKVTMQDETLNHLKLAQTWNRLLEKVRQISGFEHFLQPAPCSSLLRNIPDSGVVVLINVHKDRSDALALINGKTTPIHIPLVEFSYDLANHLYRALRSLLQVRGCLNRGSDVDPVLRGMRLVKQGGLGIKEILKQLWLSVAKPILDALESIEHLEKETPLVEKKRIWWCTTGPLAFLPIHAAGIYEESERVALPDFIVSSYIPTIASLLRSSISPSVIPKQHTGCLIISQPHTPGLTPIPATAAEAKGIEQLFQNNGLPYLWIDGGAGTLENVTTQLDKFNCIHLSCHAVQDNNLPLNSSFHLHDGQLRLSEIIKKNMTAGLAFLSACQTSTGDENLSEEVVHLAAGMLVAGYRGVIATMWSIQDRHCPQVSNDFYTTF
ncbi:hypothetical protein CVT26_009229 [Gymnopilus dilepis]|uniref:CHAT domain-containing protein n=1 Tax=Gymnopilus dilepis TaxID=231916 RepID=A0A409YRL7_9AGAR|nr:hypothetical protein CVT26_009229 [Gymnopilus dilepis]